MNRLRQLVRALRHLVRRDRISRELEEEMRSHVAMRADAIRAAGATPAEARAEARRRFGNVTQWGEASREAWGGGGTERLMRDIGWSVRRLRTHPGFTLAVTLVLALGIGATTAMFSAVDAAMLRPLPFREAGSLAVLPMVRMPFDAGDGQPASTSTQIDFDQVRAMPHLFSDAAVFAVGAVNIPDPVRPVRVRAGVVSETFFRTLGVHPASGRSFSPAESAPKGPHVVVLSDAFWRAHFGGRDVRGTTIPLNLDRYEVIGVMPPGFSFPADVDLWIPMTNPVTGETFRAFRGYLSSTVVARLAPGVSVPEADAQLTARWAAIAAADAVPGREGAADRNLAGVREEGAAVPLLTHLAGDTRRPLLILLGATVLLLLIACANVTNLLLSQAATRRREIALREIEGRPRGDNAEMLFARQYIVSGGYFAALGIPVLQGRTFEMTDDADHPPTAIISQTMASRYWPGENPVGRRFGLPGDSVLTTVIGVVADVRGDGLDVTPEPQMYLSVRYRSMANLAVVVRSDLPGPALLRALTGAVRAVDPAQAVYNVRMMDEVIGRSVASRRTNTLLIAAFGGLALILASVGVYAVVSYGVSQRRREFGIRAALGAAGTDLVRLVGRDMLWVAATGTLAGVAGAWALSRVLATLLFEVEPHDAATFVAVPAMLLLVALVATLIPARRTLRVNPAEVIRGE